MNKKYQVIALIGKSGAGKDTMMRATCAAHPLMLHPIVGCTTRPCREHEVDGVDYNFISLESYTKQVLRGDMLEASEFRNWFYGTPIDALARDKINIGVFNPEGLYQLMKDPRLNVWVIKIDCDDKTRLMRSLSREDNPNCDEICRRFFADKEDFNALKLEEYTIVSSFDGCDENILSESHSIDMGRIEQMWQDLDIGTAFETIVRWETSMFKKAESDNDKDNIE